METIEVVYVPWYLSDRWGSREEGGCSIHKSLEDFGAWKKIYDEKVIGTDCYYVPYKPKTARIEAALYEEMLKSSYGLRFEMEEEDELVKNGSIIYDKRI
jgi:hypothetical protein